MTVVYYYIITGPARCVLLSDALGYVVLCCAMCLYASEQVCALPPPDSRNKAGSEGTVFKTLPVDAAVGLFSTASTAADGSECDGAKIVLANFTQPTDG